MGKRVWLFALVLLYLIVCFPKTLGEVRNARMPQQKTFIIMVSRNGFNSTDQFNITVNQGDQVTITFVYDDGDLQTDNPHRMTIDGFDIHTGVINKANPSVTVKFLADQSGSFNFYCVIYCVGMDKLQSGNLIVIPSS